MTLVMVPLVANHKKLHTLSLHKWLMGYLGFCSRRSVRIVEALELTFAVGTLTP